MFILRKLSYVQLVYASYNFWDNFPHSILTPLAVRWYVNAFLSSFNQVDLSEGEQHALRVCCLLAIPPPPQGAGDVTLNVTPDLSQVTLNLLVRLVKDLASGMGQLDSHIEANHTVISKTLIPHLSRITGQTACMTCLRPRQSCDCRPSVSYEQLQTSPPTFTMLTSTAPHQVTSQAGSLHLMGMSYLGSLWPQPGPLQDLPPLLRGGCHQDSQSSPHQQCDSMLATWDSLGVMHLLLTWEACLH